MAESANDRWWLDLELAPPGLQDNTADADRLLAALRARLDSEAVGLELALARRLPERLRRWGYRVRCCLARDRTRWVLTDVRDPDAERPLPALAIDLGTTRIALQLVDLRDGHSLGEAVFDNPQSAVAPDVLARIHAAGRPGGLEQLQRLVCAGLAERSAALCREAGLRPDELLLGVVAGNTTMGHLLLGLDPRWLIREPYIPATNTPGLVPAAALDLGWAAGAQLFVFPNVGAYFGGDLIAGILCAGLDARDEPGILVDVGTNAEVVLGNRDWLIGCAGAAGPALESGVAAIGMPAGDGVIERVRLGAGGALEFDVIGGGAPLGICGSGLIDLAAALFRSGRIDLRGQLVPAACGGRCRQGGDGPELVLVPAAESASGTDLVLDQRSLTSLKKAKAAMFTILETLCAAVAMTPEQLAAFYVGGTFGSVIDPESAITIGMLPDLPRQRYRVLGNSSLGGALHLLRHAAAIERIHAIRDRITYMELNVNQDFMIRFSGAQFFPHTDPGRFPSVPPPVGRSGA
jgi:uncharacterized 2Fe-2S/4Fe-4S cluster protein (DUF4445 family)